MTDAKSELEIAAEECADEVSQRDHHGTDRDLILCGFNSGALWLLAELERKFSPAIADIECGMNGQVALTTGLRDVLKYARELCGK